MRRPSPALREKNRNVRSIRALGRREWYARSGYGRSGLSGIHAAHGIQRESPRFTGDHFRRVLPEGAGPQQHPGVDREGQVPGSPIRRSGALR